MYVKRSNQTTSPSDNEQNKDIIDSLVPEKTAS